MISKDINNCPQAYSAPTSKVIIVHVESTILDASLGEGEGEGIGDGGND